MLKRIKDGLKVMIGKADAVPKKIIATDQSFSCPVCRKSGINFYPLPFYFLRELDRHQFIHPFFASETLNIEFYSCSNCGSNDRDRLYALYFDKILAGRKDHLRVLEIAPRKGLTDFLRAFTNVRVRTADLFMEEADDKVDITNMAIYADDSFDVFICSHVLEHIDNDIKAMSELYRVTKKGGWGIAMVPINLSLKENYEDASIKDEAGRWKHFGQYDHVRFYAKNGFIQRLSDCGFTVHQFDISYFGADVFHENGIHPRSVLYIAGK